MQDLIYVILGFLLVWGFLAYFNNHPEIFLPNEETVLMGFQR